MVYKLFAPSGCFQAAKTVLTAKLGGVSVTLVSEFDRDSAEFRSWSPLGKTPVLLTSEGPLSEANAVMRFVASLRPERNLFGKTFYQHALVDQWVDFCQSDLEVARGVLEYAAQAADQKAADAGTTALESAMAVLDNHLLHETMMVGNAITLADVAICCTLAWAGAASAMAKFGNLQRWFVTCMHAAEFKAVLGGVESLVAAPAAVAVAPAKAGSKGKAENKQQRKGSKGKAPAPAAAAAVAASGGMHAAVQAQADVVRSLKASNAGVPEVKAAVEKLLALKAQHSGAGAATAASGVHPAVKAQADLVRSMKANQAGVSEVKAAVLKLQALKAQHAGGAAAASPAKEGKKKKDSKKGGSAPAAAAAAGGVHPAVQAQADLVRTLKGKKADAAEVKAAVQRLLELKAEHGAGAAAAGAGGSAKKEQKKEKKSKKSKGKNKKPDVAPAGEVPAEVTAAGAKVRALKQAKADPVEVKAAVDALLALKAKHGIGK